MMVESEIGLSNQGISKAHFITPPCPVTYPIGEAEVSASAYFGFVGF